MEDIRVGNMTVLYQDPLTSQRIPIYDIDKYLEENDSIAIYFLDDPVPYVMKMTYFKNILIDDNDFLCKNGSVKNEKPEYYNLRKLFLNTDRHPQIIVPIEEFDKCIKTRKIILLNTKKKVKIVPKTYINVIKKWSKK